MAEEMKLRESRVERLLSDSVGSRLQAVRKLYGLSQRELARRAEVTNSTLSMIEQGKVSPSISSLEKILQAFPMSLQEFFSESLELSPAVFYSEDFVHVQKGRADYHVMHLDNPKVEGMYLSLQHYPPGAVVDSEWMINNGFIGGIVTEGALELHLDGVEYILKQGDGFHFSLHRDHSFQNKSDSECTVVSVSFSE